MEQQETLVAEQVKNSDYFADLWINIIRDLKLHYGENLHKSWFRKLGFIDVQGGKLVLLSAPSNFIRDWIKSNYLNTICELWKHYDNDITEVDVITQEGRVNDNIQEEKFNKVFEGDRKVQDENDISALLDPRFTFDNFVVGSPNELAYAAALSVAENSSAATKSNPLFLYGGVGLGKTHLMHAIAWLCREKNPDRKVLYMSAEKFMYRFIKALRSKDVMTFKEEFRSVDVLMIDDIQFICGKESTQEEFFHTFNAIVDNNKQMVISCDRSPTDLDNVESRIKSRLGWGLVADVHSTTYELRIGILESKLEKMEINISPNVIDFLASKITSNVRELEGALNKVIAHSTLIGKEVTLESTQDILSDLLRSNDRVVSIKDIQKQIASRYNIKVSDMQSAKRLRSIARPRQIAMYLCKALTSMSLADIGDNFGKKDHSTVIHAVKKIEQLMDSDGDFREEINLISKILQS